MKTNNLFLKHLFAAFVVVALVGAVTILAINNTRERTACEANINSLSAAAKQAGYDELIKTETQTAVSLLQTIYEKQQQGIYTTEKAKELGADLLRDLRYGSNGAGYFFADTTEGVNVVLYGSDVEGTNRYEANLNGVYYIKEILKNGAKEGGGYTDYWYPKKDQSEAKAKRAYSLIFQPFGWVVGTGYYLEDL